MITSAVVMPRVYVRHSARTDERVLECSLLVAHARQNFNTPGIIYSRVVVKRSQTSGLRLDMAAKEALKVVVFLGSVRENNFGSRAAKFIVRKLTESGHEPILLGTPGMQSAL